MQKLYVFSFLILFSIPFFVFGQSAGSVSGTVTELKSKKPLAFVNVILKNQQNNTVIRHEVTDDHGAYTFKSIPDGNYYVQATYIGYNNYKTSSFLVNNLHRNIRENIMLDNPDHTLQEVTVSSKKMVYVNSIDKKVYNVDQDMMAKSGSASDVLQNVPLVQVDIDGNVSLRNSTVTILINGKVSPLMGTNAAAVLQQLPANSIEKIEVITNPSAKYKPDGTGGIINIVLKKNVKRGLNGTVTGNLGDRGRYNTSTSLNYNTGKLNLFGSYSIKQDDRLRTTTNDRTQINQQTGVSGTYHDFLTARAHPFSNIANLGFDYTIDKKNSFGLTGNFYLRNLHKDDVTNKLVNNPVGNQDYDRFRKNFEQEKSTDGAFYFEHGFKKEDHKIRFEANLAHSPESEDNHYSNVYRMPAIADEMDNTLIKQTADIRQVAVAYENPLSKDSKLEAGYDGQFNKHDLDFSGAFYNPAVQQFVPDVQKTNHFIYKENIQAVYGTFTQAYHQMTMMLGVRGEYSNIDSHLITTGVDIPNHYFKIYPTLHLSYKVAENKELQLNYSRRVRRPQADDLNPFAEYADPTNIRVGNPYLLPEIINSVEAGYKWSKNGISLLPGIYYRYTVNRFTAITEPLNDSVLVTRQQNLANDRAFGADVVVSANIQDKLIVNFTPNIFYNQIDASNLGYSNKKSTVTWTANLNASYSLNTLTTFQLNSTYKSARLTPQGKYLPSYVMNLGAKRDVLNKKASIYLTVSDVFKTQRQEANLQSLYLIQHVKTISNSRIIYLGFSYNFGVVKKKKDMQFDNSL
ncbi:TonB-dependent receptor domain-containing protein [Pedobacter cryoconitis]|uniref:Outer membrane receptor protein involved in Fe transport n=1 Tax=Pedobacter cryoconitis TaxID=188932 RepID=A0A7X0MHB7_9SPHI|nr:TonB-dependent receptor [Pedobacter cryoconitis]MBB6499217.1 outer membrane receptor protein involved in Fe transport [Pedobacter cryoconitis]